MEPNEKVIQFQAMPETEFERNGLYCLTDKGNIYRLYNNKWEKLRFTPPEEFLPEKLKGLWLPV